MTSTHATCHHRVSHPRKTLNIADRERRSPSSLFNTTLLKYFSLTTKTWTEKFSPHLWSNIYSSIWGNMYDTNPKPVPCMGKEAEWNGILHLVKGHSSSRWKRRQLVYCVHTSPLWQTPLIPPLSMRLTSKCYEANVNCLASILMLFWFWSRPQIFIYIVPCSATFPPVAHCQYS